MPLPGWNHCYNLIYLYFSSGYFLFLVYGQPTVVPGKEICCFACSVVWGSEERGLPPLATNCFFLDWRAGLMLQQFFLNCRSGWGTINLRLRTPWHQSAHKADIPLAVLLAMLEEPERPACPRGMVETDFTIFDFLFFILFDIFKMEPLLQIDCLWQYELGK